MNIIMIYIKVIGMLEPASESITSVHIEDIKITHLVYITVDE
jgi:hypothetical protein